MLKIVTDGTRNIRNREINKYTGYEIVKMHYDKETYNLIFVFFNLISIIVPILFFVGTHFLYHGHNLLIEVNIFGDKNCTFEEKKFVLCLKSTKLTGNLGFPG